MKLFSPLTVLLLFTFLLLAEAVIDVFIGAFMGHLLGDMVGEHKKLIKKVFIGGPTSIATHAIKGVTPLIGHSLLGDRFDQFLYTTLGWAVGFTVNLITTIIENTLNWSIEGGLLALQAFLILLDFILPGAKRELPQNIFPGIGNILSGTSSSALEEISRKGRIYPEREKASQSPYDVTSELLERNPLLERFLEAVHLDEDDCLKEIICSINSSADENMTKEEINFKVDFRTLTKKYKTIFPSLTSFVTASNTGEKAKTLKACQATYPKCKYPLLARALFIYLSRFTSHR